MRKDNNEMQHFFKSLTRSLKVKDANTTEITLTKNQLISPLLRKCFKKGYFSNILKDYNINFICDDEELFFNEEETNFLFENLRTISKKDCELYFIENINGTVEVSQSNENDLLNYHHITKKVQRTCFEILEINRKLTLMAKTINKMKLSPLEKYWLCHKIVSNIEYYSEGSQNDQSQSFVETVKQNRGCCVGKAHYLKALLSLVGINASIVNVDINRSDREHFRYFERIMDSGNREIKTLDEYLKSQTEFEQLTHTDHVINIIYLYDKKYDINGIFAGDPTQLFQRFIPLNGNIEDVFNLGAFLSSRVTELKYFLEKIDYKSVLSEEDEDKLEQRYLTYVKPIIINDLDKKIPIVSADSYLYKIYFLSEIKKCNSAIEIKSLFDNERSSINVLTGEPNKFSKIYEETFEKWFDNSNEQLLNSLDAIENRIELESVPKARDISQETYYKLTEMANNIYDKYFLEKDESKSLSM